MLKRISPERVRPGMFVEAVEGVWLNAPSLARRFMVYNENEANVLRTSKVSAVFINTALGLDMGRPDCESEAAISASVVVTHNLTTKAMSSRYLRELRSALKTLNETTTLLQNVFENARDSGDVKYEDVATIVSKIATSMERNPSILVGISRLKAKDDITYIHSIAVSALMIRFARYLKLPEDKVHVLGVSGLVHDIGKIKIPTEILSKPASLTDTEMSLMRDHPSIGHKMLSRQSSMPDLVLDVCLHHHERIDGTGYPLGLSGKQISLEARMATICDVYDAVTSVRPYRAPWLASEAASWMLEKTGYFDRRLLLLFLHGAMRT